MLNSCFLLHRIRITFYLVSTLFLITFLPQPSLHLPWEDFILTGCPNQTLWHERVFSLASSGFLCCSILPTHCISLISVRMPRLLPAAVYCVTTSCMQASGWPLALLASLDVPWGHMAISQSSGPPPSISEVLKFPGTSRAREKPPSLITATSRSWGLGFLFSLFPLLFLFRNHSWALIVISNIYWVLSKNDGLNAPQNPVGYRLFLSSD